MMIKTKQIAIAEAGNWLRWIHENPTDTLKSEASVAFADEFKRNFVPSPFPGRSYYVVYDEVADGHKKNLLLISANAAKDAMSINFSRVFNMAAPAGAKAPIDHYKDAHVWLRNALEEHVIAECATKNLQNITCMTRVEEKVKAFNRLKVDVAVNGFISDKDGNAVHFNSITVDPAFGLRVTLLLQGK